ncbi:MAG: YIP1 family protein [Acidobacteriota bacterium]
MAPSRTFASIARKPTWILPLAIATGLALPLSEFVLSRTDFRKMMTARMAARGAQLTESQIDAVVEKARSLAWLGGIGALLMPSILTLAVAGILWVGCQAFGWEVRFLQSLGVTSHAFLPATLGSAALMAVLWNRNTIDLATIRDALHTNLGFFVNPQSDRALHSLLASFDLFSFWGMGLLVLGLSSAARSSRVRMGVLVGSLWALFVLGKVGFSFLLPV